MTQARASHLRLVVNEPTPVTVRQTRLRFQPVVRLAGLCHSGLRDAGLRQPGTPYAGQHQPGLRLAGQR